MNFVFAKEKFGIPKYASGSRPYVIDVNKIMSKLKKPGPDGMLKTSEYLMNMVLREEFEFSMKKKKTCIYYINPSLNLDVIKNIKKALPSMEISIKKYFLVDDGLPKTFHRHVDQVLKPR